MSVCDSDCAGESAAVHLNADLNDDESLEGSDMGDWRQDVAIVTSPPNENDDDDDDDDNNAAAAAADDDDDDDVDHVDVVVPASAAPVSPSRPASVANKSADFVAYCAADQSFCIEATPRDIRGVNMLVAVTIAALVVQDEDFFAAARDCGFNVATARVDAAHCCGLDDVQAALTTSANPDAAMQQVCDSLRAKLPTKEAQRVVVLAVVRIPEHLKTLFNSPLVMHRVRVTLNHVQVRGSDVPACVRSMYYRGKICTDTKKAFVLTTSQLRRYQYVRPLDFRDRACLESLPIAGNALFHCAFVATEPFVADVRHALSAFAPHNAQARRCLWTVPSAVIVSASQKPSKGSFEPSPTVNGHTVGRLYSSPLAAELLENSVLQGTTGQLDAALTDARGTIVRPQCVADAEAGGSRLTAWLQLRNLDKRAEALARKHLGTKAGNVEPFEALQKLLQQSGGTNCATLTSVGEPVCRQMALVFGAVLPAAVWAIAHLMSFELAIVFYARGIHDSVYRMLSGPSPQSLLLNGTATQFPYCVVRQWYASRPEIETAPFTMLVNARLHDTPAFNSYATAQSLQIARTRKLLVDALPIRDFLHSAVASDRVFIIDSFVRDGVELRLFADTALRCVALSDQPSSTPKHQRVAFVLEEELVSMRTWSHVLRRNGPFRAHGIDVVRAETLADIDAALVQHLQRRQEGDASALVLCNGAKEKARLEALLCSTPQVKLADISDVLSKAFKPMPTKHRLYIPYAHSVTLNTLAIAVSVLVASKFASLRVAVARGTVSEPDERLFKAHLGEHVNDASIQELLSASEASGLCGVGLFVGGLPLAPIVDSASASREGPSLVDDLFFSAPRAAATLDQVGILGVNDSFLRSFHGAGRLLQLLQARESIRFFAYRDTPVARAINEVESRVTVIDAAKLPAPIMRRICGASFVALSLDGGRLLELDEIPTDNALVIADAVPSNVLVEDPTSLRLAKPALGLAVEQCRVVAADETSAAPNRDDAHSLFDCVVVGGKWDATNKGVEWHVKMSSLLAAERSRLQVGASLNLLLGIDNWAADRCFWLGSFDECVAQRLRARVCSPLVRQTPFERASNETTTCLLSYEACCRSLLPFKLHH